MPSFDIPEGTTPENSNKTGLRIWLRMRIAKMEIFVWSLYGQYMVTFVTIY